jgi:hypothetical protein
MLMETGFASIALACPQARGEPGGKLETLASLYRLIRSRRVNRRLNAFALA